MKNWLAGIIAAVIAGVIVYWLTQGGQETDKPLQVVITSPTTNTTVEMVDQIRGYVSDPTAKVWLVIHPLQSSDCWIQQAVIVEADGSWASMARFGENNSAHRGLPYEIRALANPIQTLSKGRTACWPSAKAVSRALYVRRS